MSDTHANTVAYVRNDMLPPSEAPRSQTGAVKWMRKTCFLVGLTRR
jgi:general L-amino acid transport system permease protein